MKDTGYLLFVTVSLAAIGGLSAMADLQSAQHAGDSDRLEAVCAQYDSKMDSIRNTLNQNETKPSVDQIEAREKDLLAQNPNLMQCSPVAALKGMKAAKDGLGGVKAGTGARGMIKPTTGQDGTPFHDVAYVPPSSDQGTQIASNFVSNKPSRSVRSADDDVNSGSHFATGAKGPGAGPSGDTGNASAGSAADSEIGNGNSGDSPADSSPTIGGKGTTSEQ